MVNLPCSTRALIWLGDTREAISAFPKAAKRTLGFGLRQVQNGLVPRMAERLGSYGPGVYELKAKAGKDAYRVVYAVKLAKGVYVLHAFMKKSKSGKKIPRDDRETIRARLKHAKAMDAD